MHPCGFTVPTPNAGTCTVHIWNSCKYCDDPSLAGTGSNYTGEPTSMSGPCDDTPPALRTDNGATAP